MVACTTGAFGCSPGGLMYAQATTSIRDFNMIVAPFPLHGRASSFNRSIAAAIACAFTSHLQTCCHRQFPNWSQMWACPQDVVPGGGIVGGLIGAIEGAIGPQVHPAVGMSLMPSCCERSPCSDLNSASAFPSWVSPSGGEACTCELNAHKAKATMTR